MKVLRVLLKILLGFLVSGLTLLLITAGFIYYVLSKPELNIPEKTLRWASENLLKPLGYEVSFKSMQMMLSRQDHFYLRHLAVKSEDLKIGKQGLLSAHIPDLRLELSLDFHPKHYGITEVGPIDIQDSKLFIKLPAADPKQPDTGFELDPIWLERLRKTRFKPIHVGLKGLIVEQPLEPKMMAQIDLNLQKLDMTHWTLALLVDKVKGLPIHRGLFNLSLQMSEGPSLTPLTATLKGNADLVKLGKAVLNGELQWDSPEKAQFKLDLLSNIGDQKQSLQASGKLDHERFDIKLSGQATYPVPSLQKVDLESCQFGGTLQEKTKPFLDSKLNCHVTLTREASPKEKAFEDMLPKVVQLNIRGPLTIAKWNQNPSFEALLTIGITPLQSQIYTLRSSSLINLNGRFFGGLKSLHMVIDTNTQITLDKFQAVVNRLSKTDFYVPAPFNTLDGHIQCDVQGRIQQLGALIHLPVSCTVDLKSEAQALFVTARGLVKKELDKKAQIQLAVILDRVTFEVPKLALNGKVPQIFPDKRISKVKDRATGEEEQGLPVILDIKITTPANRPLTLVTQLSKVPVPISFDLQITGEDMRPTGSIAIQDYQVSFLKKQAYVDHLRLILRPDEEPPGLDGLVIFKDPDVRISLKLSGTLDRPFYVLESQPPQAPTQLLSMILFGGNAGALDDNSLRSVEETRAAMVDGALGLLSMYYLASTPIDSVGYNPYTGLFRARVKVAQGLSLMVGSDLEGVRQSVTLRKRLTENWSFETGAETDEETKKNHGVALFKWGRRY